jgi:hypothetical protein
VRISLVLTIVSMLARGAAADMIVVPAPEPRTLEAQVGGGIGDYAAAFERWLGFSIGWHPGTEDRGGLIGDEIGVDLDLRVGYAVYGSSLAIGVRPVARYSGPNKIRTPSFAGLLAPEILWSTGDGREHAWRVEWSLPIAIPIGGHDAIEWDVVRGGAIFAGDGAHASIGTELRFVLR